jgi:hypothetical protein
VALASTQQMLAAANAAKLEAQAQLAEVKAGRGAAAKPGGAGLSRTAARAPSRGAVRKPLDAAASAAASLNASANDNAHFAQADAQLRAARAATAAACAEAEALWWRLLAIIRQLLARLGELGQEAVMDADVLALPPRLIALAASVGVHLPQIATAPSSAQQLAGVGGAKPPGRLESAGDSAIVVLAAMAHAAASANAGSPPRGAVHGDAGSGAQRVTGTRIEAFVGGGSTGNGAAGLGIADCDAAAAGETLTLRL